MKLMHILPISILLAASPAVAAGKHAGGHGHGSSGSQSVMMAVGQPGEAENVTRSIDVVMKETSEGAMVFEPARIEVRRGETIRFVIRNDGELEHEFVLDNHHGVMEHKEMMEKMPEMEHADPNSLRLDPGMDGEIIWSFVNEGSFEFACLIPGHYDAGMRGELAVSDKLAMN